jgi:hypothetical protein
MEPVPNRSRLTPMRIRHAALSFAVCSIALLLVSGCTGHPQDRGAAVDTSRSAAGGGSAKASPTGAPLTAAGLDCKDLSVQVVASGEPTAIVKAVGQRLESANFGDLSPVPMVVETGQTLIAEASGPCKEYVTFYTNRQGVLSPIGARTYLAKTVGAVEIDVAFHGCSACAGPSLPIGRVAVAVQAKAA